MRHATPLYTQSEVDSLTNKAHACGWIAGITFVTGLILIGVVIL